MAVTLSISPVAVYAFIQEHEHCGELASALAGRSHLDVLHGRSGDR
jgi:hypothetical protein